MGLEGFWAWKEATPPSCPVLTQVHSTALSSGNKGTVVISTVAMRGLRCRISTASAAVVIPGVIPSQQGG